MNNLTHFVSDIPTKNDLQAFLLDYIQQYAVDKVFNREDVSGIADAKKIIEDAFNQLQVTYGVQAPKTKPTSQSK